MDNNSEKEALKAIELQLELGFLDIDSRDPWVDEFALVCKAIEEYKRNHNLV